MREQNWDRTPVATNVLNSSDWQLSDAMESIERKIQTAERTITSLRQQMATVHILKGAIASAGAKRSADRASTFNTSALFSFKSALSIPGHEQDLVTKELEAHQLRKLQMFAAALDAYTEVERLAANSSSPRIRDLTIARAKRYKAEILQMSASTSTNGVRTFNGCGAANLLVSRGVFGSALSLMAPHAPFSDWESLEEADTCYLAAFVAHNLNFVPMSNTVDEAKTSYKRVLATKTRPWAVRSRRELRRRAKEGLERVDAAQQATPVFSGDWLNP